MENSENDILIIGSGIGGPVLGMLLKQAGYNPIIFEKVSNCLETTGATITIAPNGLKVLNTINCTDLVLNNGITIKKFALYNSNGDLIINSIVEHVAKRYGWPMVGIRRSLFQKLLNERAKSRGIPIHYGKKLVDIKQYETRVEAIFADGTSYKGSFLVGCDGLHSRTRSILFGDEKPSYTGITQTIGISTLVPDSDGEFSQFFGDQAFFITYPFNSTQMAWAGTLEEPESKESWNAASTEELYEFSKNSVFNSWTSLPLIQKLIHSSEKIIKLGIYDRPPLKTWSSQRVTLIGDAAHPSSPHLGLGGNLCIEDAYIVTQLLSIYCPNPNNITTESLSQVFKNYEEKRIPFTTKIVEKARNQGKLRVATSNNFSERDAAMKKRFGDEKSFAEEWDQIYGVQYDPIIKK
eukprot:gene9196-11271_t